VRSVARPPARFATALSRSSRELHRRQADAASGAGTLATAADAPGGKLTFKVGDAPQISNGACGSSGPRARRHLRHVARPRATIMAAGDACAVLDQPTRTSARARSRAPTRRC
jgi:hypothetical protein